jgi:nucleoside-diphosphate-sugar epimerase
MNVLVTGATGFVGRHVVHALRSRGHRVVAVVRDATTARALPWLEGVELVECDLHRNPERLFDLPDLPRVLVHLAWPGLPDCRGDFHVVENLPADLRWLDRAVAAGIGQLVVAGTCLEYGMQTGALHEDGETKPVIAYGIAKDTLRKRLEAWQQSRPFTLQWMRLFYLYGEGQRPTSVLPQLDRLIDEGGTVFDMSNGDQLRDYLPIEEAARYFARVVEHPECNGAINCSRGVPISVRELIERRCRERGATIALNLGRYGYVDYEPHEFWGIPAKLRALPAASSDD